MSSQRDLFANFERMRREMDELFGDVFGRPALAPRGRPAFSPRVDVFYVTDPPRAVVQAELAGVTVEDVGLEIRGRELVLTGQRRPAPRDEAEGRVYQQLEIEHGPFRRVIELGADVEEQDATAVYEDGILRVELPLVTEQASPARSVPIQVPKPGESEGA